MSEITQLHDGDLVDLSGLDSIYTKCCRCDLWHEIEIVEVGEGVLKVRFNECVGDPTKEKTRIWLVPALSFVMVRKSHLFRSTILLMRKRKRRKIIITEARTLLVRN